MTGKYFRLVAGGFLVMAVFGFAGCDSFGGNEDTVPISTNVDFCFLFNSDTLQVNQPAFVRAESAVDLTGILSREGFTKSDLRSADVESAILEVIFPADAPVSFLKDVKFGIESSGQVATVMASRSQFPTDPNLDTVVMTIAAPLDFVRHLQASSFRGVLELIPASLESNEVYEIQVRLKMIMRVPF